MGTRLSLSLVAVLSMSLSGCHHWCPYCAPYTYGYGACVDCCGYDGFSLFSFDPCGGCSCSCQTCTRRHGCGARRPCRRCGRMCQSAGMGAYCDPYSLCGFDGCWSGCGPTMYGGCGFGPCDPGACGFSPCGSGTCQGGMCGHGQGMTGSDQWSSMGTSSHYGDVNTGWGPTGVPHSSQQPTPMAPPVSSEYYAPTGPNGPMRTEPQPTEASGAQFLMPQQGSAAQPILWAPPGR